MCVPRFPGARLRAIALTIDDSPSPVLTRRILAVLRQYDVTATFFVIGENAKLHPEILAELAEAGHELGNHMLRDEPSARLPVADFEQQLKDTHTLLAPYMWGRWRSGAPKWCRPGHGWFNERMLGAMQRQGYKCVLGGVYGLDPQLHAPRLISRHLAWGAYGGAIIVLHDGGGHRVTQTVQVLDWIIPQLLDRGYEFMTLSELWNNSCYSATESGSAEESSSPAGRPLTSA